MEAEPIKTRHTLKRSLTHTLKGLPLTRRSLSSYHYQCIVCVTMAYLFTKHDPFHIHKLLGFTALLHFLCRFVLALCTGTAFPDSEPAWSRYGFLLVHVALHATSFVFRLPNKRNFKQPMIW